MQLNDHIRGLLSIQFGAVMSVGNICNRNVVLIGKHDSIFTAARLMRDHHVSDVVVVESSKGINIPLGVLSDRDIVVKIIAAGQDLNTVSISDLMSDQLLTVNETDEVMPTLKRMRHKGVRRIPVIGNDSGLLGLLSIDDILDTLAEQLNDIDQIISQDQYQSSEGLHVTLSS